MNIVQTPVQAVMKKAVQHAPDRLMPGGTPDPTIHRHDGLIGAAVPSAGESPSQVTGMLNADLRRRASQAFA